MILDLGSSFDLIRVTAEYSNAVLVAVLPQISDVAQKLDLPLPHPIKAAQVSSCSVLPNGRVEAEVSVKGGWVFAFRRGYVNTIQGPHEFFMIQDFDRIPEFFGEVKMSTDQAIQRARDTLHKLGIPLEAVFAEQEPRVSQPPKVGTNTVPHYRIEWIDPRAVGQAPACVDIDIDAQAKRVERISIRNKSLERPPPKVSVIPPREPNFTPWPQVNPEYAWRLLPIVLRAVEDYGKRLSLDFVRPVSTDEVSRFSVADNGGWPHAELELTNGWQFIFRNNMVNGYYAPDNFFNSDDRPIRIKDFLGKWRMDETEARDLVRRSLAKLNYPTNLVHFEVEPQVHKPAIPGIPRFMFYWYYNENGELRSTIWGEVDAERRELKSLYFDDKAFWNHPPAIDVPILSPPSLTDQPDSKPSAKPAVGQPARRHFAPPAQFKN